MAFLSERQNTISVLAREDGVVDVEDLSGSFDVSSSKLFVKT